MPDFETLNYIGRAIGATLNAEGVEYAAMKLKCKERNLKDVKVISYILYEDSTVVDVSLRGGEWLKDEDKSVIFVKEDDFFVAVPIEGLD